MTKINQLFKENIDIDFLLRLISFYGYKSLNDTLQFTINDLEKLGTHYKLMEISDTLKDFYLPCKAHIYLDDLNCHKAITILRQILKLFSIKLISKQKYIFKKKTTIYSIGANINSQSHSIKHFSITNQQVVLNFT